MTLHDYLAESARAFPDRTAVVDPSGRTLSYRELHAAAQSIAGFLVARGIQTGDRVGVIAPKSGEVVATLFGILSAGAAYVPADYSAPAERNRTLLSDCAVRLVFLDRTCAAILDDWPGGGPPPEVVWFSGGAPGSAGQGPAWSAVAAHPALAPPCAVGDADLAYILYTSGSTGRPKGVTLTHGNATRFVDWCSAEFAPLSEDRFSSHAPFHFDLSVLDLYLSIKHGSALFLVSEELGKNPEALAKFIADNRLTVWYSTPSILGLLAQFGGLHALDCSALRIVLFAGEVFPVKHLRTIVEHWPQAGFYNLYGPTETNVCTFAKIPPSIPPERVEPYPIGHLCPYCSGLVLDTAGGREVARGEEGLLHIAGGSLFQGYWNRPDPGLFFERNGDRYYNTGDVVRDAGAEGYVYVGRRDRMVKRRGYRIELGEIERGLYQHEGIREAAAIAVPDASSGQRICAFVSPQPGRKPTIIELKTFCHRVLPAYMVPDVFLLLDALPRTSTDKVDYQGLIRRVS